jgi:hypothetical protein
MYPIRICVRTRVSELLCNARRDDGDAGTSRLWLSHVVLILVLI